MSTQVQVDRVCPKTVSSRWYYVEMSSRHLVITTSGFGGFLLPVCICRQEKSALDSLAWLHMKTWIYPLDFSTCDTSNPSYAWNLFFTIWNFGLPFVSHQNLGDSNRCAKNSDSERWRSRCQECTIANNSALQTTRPPSFRRIRQVWVDAGDLFNARLS